MVFLISGEQNGVSYKQFTAVLCFWITALIGTGKLSILKFECNTCFKNILCKRPHFPHKVTAINRLAVMVLDTLDATVNC